MNTAIETPVGWNRLQIGQCASVKRGASPRPIEDPKWWGGEVGWVRISDVTSSRKYLTKTRDYLSGEGIRKSIQIQVGEVVLSICATIGRPIITTVPVCIHDGFVWFKGLPGDIDREYFYYYLASKEAELANSRQTGTQGNLNTTIVSKLELLFPSSKAEQAKIAEILSTVDRAIEQTEVLIGKQQRIKAGLMQDLLTRGIDEHGIVRSERTHQFKDSLLGRIPFDWEVEAIEDNLECVIDYRGRTPVKTEAGIPLVTAKNVRDGFLSEEPREFIATENFNSWMTRGVPNPGDVMFTTEAPMGNVARVPEYKIALAQRVITLPTKEPKLSSDFLYCILHWAQTRERLDLLTSGSTVVGVKQSVFRKVPFSFPSRAEQDRITQILFSHDTVTANEKKMLTKLSLLKTALMQGLLTGKKRVISLLDARAVQ